MITIFSAELRDGKELHLVLCPNWEKNACQCDPVAHHTHIYTFTAFNNGAMETLDAFIARSTDHALEQEAIYRQPKPDPVVQLDVAALRSQAAQRGKP